MQRKKPASRLPLAGVKIQGNEITSPLHSTGEPDAQMFSTESSKEEWSSQENMHELCSFGTNISFMSASELRKALQDAEQKNNDLKESLTQASRKLKASSKKARKLEENLSSLTTNLKFLNDDQKAALQKTNRKGCVWNSETIKKAQQLKFECGSTGYDLLLEQGNPLPSRRTLCRRLQHFSFKPGVLTEIISVMETKLSAMTDIEKDCVLFMDEMEIRKGVELDCGCDSFLGKITLPEWDQPANHALVFMVGGINSRWKQVIAYHYTGSFVNGDKLKDFVLHLLKLCADISLRVLCVTCDMGRDKWLQYGEHLQGTFSSWILDTAENRSH